MLIGFADVGLLVGIAAVAYVITRLVVSPLLIKAVRRTPTRWDDIICDRRVLNRAAILVPLVILRMGVPLLGSPADAEAIDLTNRVVEALIVIFALLAIGAAISAADRVYMTFEGSAERPIKGYLQAATLVVWLFGLILVIARLANQPIGALLTGLGAVSAILLLIFRDTLLSLTASVQLSNSDMLRLGDWIEVPDQSANGTVEDVSLLTIKVRNFDNTVTTIPTYQLISNPFKNWRGMTESGRRRMKRSINVDAATIRNLTDTEVAAWSSRPLVGKHVRQRAETLAAWNADASRLEKRLTNVGLFRAYAYAFLRSHPHVVQDETVMVRQLEPHTDGVPVELYAFIDTVVWDEYESIQSDIFDHLFATIGSFDLRIHQSPTGADLASIGSRPSESEESRT